MSKPKPGSIKAIEQGCTCAVMDNHYGRGFGNPPQFWISGDCPLHGFPSLDTVSDLVPTSSKPPQSTAKPQSNSKGEPNG